MRKNAVVVSLCLVTINNWRNVCVVMLSKSTLRNLLFIPAIDTGSWIEKLKYVEDSLKRFS